MLGKKVHDCNPGASFLAGTVWSYTGGVAVIWSGGGDREKPFTSMRLQSALRSGGAQHKQNDSIDLGTYEKDGDIYIAIPPTHNTAVTSFLYIYIAIALVIALPLISAASCIPPSCSRSYCSSIASEWPSSFWLLVIFLLIIILRTQAGATFAVAPSHFVNGSAGSSASGSSVHW